MKRNYLILALALALTFSGPISAQAQYIAPYSGAVSRTNNSKMADIVSVFDFIPVSLQAAIKAGTSTTDVSSYLTAMQAAVPAGPCFLFPAGQYNIGAGPVALTGRCISIVGVTFTGGGAITGALTEIYTQTNTIFITPQNSPCNGTGDDATAINAAVTQIATASVPYGTVKIACSLIKLNSTVSNKYSNIYIKGLGSDANHTTGQCGQAGTKVTWGGAAGGTMMEMVASTDVGVTQAPSGGGISGFCFEANSSAGIGLKISSRHFCRIDDIWVNQATTAGIVYTANESSENWSNQFCASTNIGAREESANGVGILFTGSFVPGLLAGASFNSFWNVYVINGTAPGIKFATGDNNVLDNVWVYNAGGGGPSIQFDGSNVNGAQSGDNLIRHFSSNVAAIFKGTSSYTYPSGDNKIDDMDIGNGTPVPILETGATGKWCWVNGTCNPRVFAADSTGTSIINNAQLALRGQTDSTKTIGLGYDTTNLFGWIQAAQEGTGTSQLKLQPNGGNVTLSTSTATVTVPGTFVLNGATSGTLTMKPAAVAGTNTITWPAATTDFSATGGTGQVLTQFLGGGQIGVARLNCNDLGDSSSGCTSAAGIAALTGDVTATGPGSVAATLATTQPNIHTWQAVQTFTSSAPQLILGVNTTTLGSIKFFGNTSGDATLQPAAVAGTATVITLPAATGTLTTLAGTEELTNKTLNASVGKGTWTASGTWTLPALTLGGTVSGGGNQINNVIIGTSTPLAGTFTTATANGFASNGSPASVRNFDGSGSTITVGNASNSAIVAGSGLIILTDTSVTGVTCGYLVGGPTASLVFSGGSLCDAATTSPAAGKISVQYDGASAYKIYNNQGASITFGVAFITTRTSF